MNFKRELENLQKVVIQCHKCPRLVAYLKEVSRNKPKRFRDWDYWGKPLPSFGDPTARFLIIGLAPAANGGNRTGRMFTGDRSGEWLFGALHRFGFANQPNSSRRDDDFALSDCYITATIRCAPPDNKPLPEEIENCRPYFLRELDLLKSVRVLVPLGQIAFTKMLKSLRMILRCDLSLRGQPIKENLPKAVCFLLFFYFFSPLVLDVEHIHNTISQG